ncbi:MAG TPA: hypothetical protein VFW37_02040 [Alphaproteobacteria bacterium]|nr:hypothetical protein [Alphaproteobacteria bacterium]
MIERGVQPKALTVEELPEATVRALAASKMDARHKHLDNLLDE